MSCPRSSWAFVIAAGCGGGTPSTVDSGFPFGTTTPSSTTTGGALPQVWINELVTSNTHGLEDEDEPGSFPDWVELWNPNDRPVDLSGWWMTDEVTDPFEWQVPDGVVIDLRAWLVVYLDDDVGQGSLHAGFKLDDFEDVALFGPNVLDNPLVDAVGLQFVPVDVSEARVPDGGAIWEQDATPTPGAPNE